MIRAWCDQLPAGLPVTTVESLTDEFLALSEVVQLDSPGSQQLMRSPSGRVLSAVPTGNRWTTRELLAIEQAALHTARHHPATRPGSSTTPRSSQPCPLTPT